MIEKFGNVQYLFPYVPVHYYSNQNQYDDAVKKVESFDETISHDMEDWILHFKDMYYIGMVPGFSPMKNKVVDFNVVDELGLLYAAHKAELGLVSDMEWARRFLSKFKLNNPWK